MASNNKTSNKTNAPERAKYIQNFFASLTREELVEIANTILPNADPEVVKEYVINDGILTRDDFLPDDEE